MQKPLTNIAFIDNTNLHKGCAAEGFQLDYRKFRKYLKEKYGVKTAYMFIGFMPQNTAMYTKFQEYGYTLVFKPTVLGTNGEIKGNCDAELVLEAITGFYENDYDKAVLVTSDGDFACLVKFLLKKHAFESILSPRGEAKCSSLLKKSGAKITFMPDIQKTIEYNKK